MGLCLECAEGDERVRAEAQRVPRAQGSRPRQLRLRIQVMLRHLMPILALPSLEVAPNPPGKSWFVMLFLKSEKNFYERNKIL